MPLECYIRTTGGKGNLNKFIERDPQICAAGVPSAQQNETVALTFQQYKLQDEVDALISDAIIPEPPPHRLPRLRRPLEEDYRNWTVKTRVSELIRAPIQTKFQTLVGDIKDTIYSSYWKKRLGESPDPVPMFPVGYDIKGTTYGKKLKQEITLYDLVLPKVPVDQTIASKAPGVQTDRNYCKPPYDPNLTYGCRMYTDPSGRLMKCALTDDSIYLGTSQRSIKNFIKSDFDQCNKNYVGEALTPINNIDYGPEGYAFGKLKRPDNLPECLTTCEIYPEKKNLLKCLAHLNTLRKCMSKKFLPTFFRTFYLELKYFDKENTGWLPKEVITKYCVSKLIIFDYNLLKPLLSMWGALNDEGCINYKTFVHILHFKEPLPNLPKITEFPPGCLDFRTTYREMIKPGQEVDLRRKAGLPSSRYFDLDFPATSEGYCRAHEVNLIQESDMLSCLMPSTFSKYSISHRDMYTKREPDVVRRVFEASGEKFPGERFNTVWEEAKKYHSQGWVCYQTFRTALEKFPEENF